MAKLLLADDSITIQKVVELVLSDEGFEIKASNNGEDALAQVSSFLPDIILADIEMPKMNGYQLCEKIKSSPATKNIPVILLAGAFEPLDEELAKKVGADDFLIKPFESEDLIKKVNASLMVSKAEVGMQAPAMEAVEVSEDLWGLEEAPSVEEEVVEVVEAVEPALEVEAVSEEEAMLEEAMLEEAVMPEEALIEEALIEEALLEEVSALPVKEAISPPEKPVFEIPKVEIPKAVEFPSKDALLDIFRKTADERISEFLKGLDLKNVLSLSIQAGIKETIEKVLWETVPELSEKLFKEALTSSIESLTKEVEKVIWETVPELAETIIKKEIEKIKSEI
ncbi:MAG: response regulator [Nitrospirae bacterium]|nr:response regulator [Nitrospirota bacterium]